MTDDWSPPTSDVALRVGPADAPDRDELLSERAGGTEGLLYQWAPRSRPLPPRHLDDRAGRSRSPRPQ